MNDSKSRKFGIIALATAVISWGCVLGVILAALAGLEGFLEVSWGLKTDLKFCQDGPRCFQDASKTAQDSIFSKKVGENEILEVG